MLETRLLSLPATRQIALLPTTGIFSLAARRGALATLQNAIGLPLPETPRRVETESATILWSGPARWLVLAEPAAAARLIAAAVPHAAVTDQSDGRVIFRVSGAQPKKILAKLIAIDLDETVFPPDATALTRAGHIDVQIWRHDAAFCLSCTRSFAVSLHHDLLTAALESEDTP